jgi:hypothetical protein
VLQCTENSKNFWNDGRIRIKKEEWRCVAAPNEVIYMINNTIEGYLKALSESDNNDADRIIEQHLEQCLVRIEPYEGRKFTARVIKMTSDGIWLQNKAGRLFFINMGNVAGLWTLAEPEHGANEPAKEAGDSDVQ